MIKFICAKTMDHYDKVMCAKTMDHYDKVYLCENYGSL